MIKHSCTSEFPTWMVAINKTEPSSNIETFLEQRQGVKYADTGSVKDVTVYCCCWDQDLCYCCYCQLVKGLSMKGGLLSRSCVRVFVWISNSAPVDPCASPVVFCVCMWQDEWGGKSACFFSSSSYSIFPNLCLSFPFMPIKLILNIKHF